MNNRHTDEKLITALYERISCEDPNKGDSYSIANQKRLLADYAEQHGYTNCIHYTDDGWSGGNFDRPAWKQLIEDVESNKVGTIIVKDMSRVGRNYLQTGIFTDALFPEHNIHFIAIGNGVDSDDQSTGEFTPFLNIMNEYYLRDLSRKQTASYLARSNAGIPTTNRVIYGYIKDPVQKHHWLIDEESANIVRRIYQMAVNGISDHHIALTLRDEKVERPQVYMARKGISNEKSPAKLSNPYDWSRKSIRQIIEKQEYLGHTVNLKFKKESYKSKKCTRRPEDEWVIIKNTHEPIIDEETWKLAQKVRKTVQRTDKTGIVNPLTGLIFCADCGAKMYNHRGKLVPSRPNGGIDPESGLLPNDFYECSTHRLNLFRTDKRCFSHHISTRAVRELVLETIRIASRNAVENQEEFISKIRSAAELRQAQAEKELRKQLSKAEKRATELNGLIKKLYESYASGKISESSFDMLISEYEKEQAEIKDLVTSGKEKLDTYTEDTDRINGFLKLAKKYTDFTQLTPQMIYEFIDKIIIHKAEKINGQRVQEVEIYLKYIGKYDIPACETNPLDTEEEKQLGKRRENGRIRAERFRKKKKAEKAAVVQENSISA